MSPLFALAKQRVTDVLRNPASTTFFLALPILFLLLFALVFPNGHPFELKAIDVVDASGSSALIDKLKAFPELRVKQVMASRTIMLDRLRVRSINAAVIKDDAGKWNILVGPNDHLLALGLQNILGENASTTVVETPHWGYVYFLFPGLLTFSVLFAGLYAMGYTMVQYRENLFLKKLKTTPLSPLTFVLAQILGRSVLVTLQVALLIAVAVIGFSLPVAPEALLTIALLSVLGMFAFSSIGFLLACLIRNESLMGDIISAIPLPIALLSGMFFTIDALPLPLQKLGAVLPSTMMVDAVREALFYSASLTAIWPQAVSMLAWGIILFGISLFLFRWDAHS
ncbi:MAG: ABC transporter permease [Pseudomonadota bacterium]